jgi:glycosyltransferase involved in cell wall biosynthesis
VAPADVGRLLAGADAAVAPYPGDDANYFSPLKVFEGMAAGLPVVASRVGQLPELIRDGRTGLLVAPGDPEALAASLVELAHAPARRARIGAAAREHVLREHTWDGVVRRVLGLAVPAGAPA